MNKLGLLALAAGLAGTAPLTVAADRSTHPAVAVPESPVVVPATALVLVGHPARGAAGRPGHANFEHPAIATHRAGRATRIDPNRYLVLPPASTTWRGPADDTATPVSR